MMPATRFPRHRVSRSRLRAVAAAAGTALTLALAAAGVAAASPVRPAAHAAPALAASQVQAVAPAISVGAVSNGLNFIFAVAADGTLWSWGLNTCLQLGCPSNSQDPSAPGQVGAEADRRASAPAAFTQPPSSATAPCGPGA